jgi:hypothetical protein
VLPHNLPNDWTSDEEFSGRRAFDGWRFTVTDDRIIPWDWADMGAAEQRQWIDLGKEGRAPPSVPAGCVCLSQKTGQTFRDSDIQNSPVWTAWPPSAVPR